MKEATVALIFGVCIGLWHAIWSLLVLVGFAQPFLDFIYGIHFLNNPFVVSQFNVVTAVTLVLVTGVIGYFFGWMFAIVWNRAHK